MYVLNEQCGHDHDNLDYYDDEDEDVHRWEGYDRVLF